MTSNPQVMTSARIRAEMADTTPPCAAQPDLFFEPDTSVRFGEKPAAKELRERSAKILCLSCPVRDLCLELARREEPDAGIWGGFTYDQIRDSRGGDARGWSA